jgi:hypothetical protein
MAAAMAAAMAAPAPARPVGSLALTRTYRPTAAPAPLGDLLQATLTDGATAISRAVAIT